MDLSALPNNNHPDKFLQLDVKSLAKTSVFLQTWLANFPEAHFSGEQQWHNRVYSQREKRNVSECPVIQLNEAQPAMIEKALGKHITPLTLKTTIKSNPLYSDGFSEDNWEERRNRPSWTVQDYDRHSLNSSLARYLKENPNDLHYWLEDLYTPGYDTLLKKKERERKRSRYCCIVLFLMLLLCILIAIVTLCILFT
ncbi:major intrinsically disordered NOTCH2-binding receptor 1-like [Sphaerodactylus townsendi]|uniref:major intrinsically disordered NOTCH2-binding receptor 1-like n=1 Tax=Sphaerodactylus townsendi TaxID=933632 RepID=UPI0020268021|nr:major intrinsically disordered NOTCH2-binding receptor 1-like [Sphaerodactylus townsendi]